MIKTFQTIVREGSFHRAAEVLRYSQPTITMQIKRLENELGVTLFERGKTMKLTKAGQFVYHRAGALLKEYTDFNRSVEEFRQGEAGVLHIGASEPSATQRLPQILAAFLEQKPNVQIQIAVGTNQQLMQMVLDDQVDFALCHQPEPHLFALCRRSDANVELEFHPFGFERFVLLLPGDHPLAEEPELSLEKLAKERFLLTPAACPFQIKLDSILSRKLGMTLQNHIEVASITALKYYVQAGLGLAFVPEVEASVLPSGTIARRMDFLEAGPELGILAQRNTLVKDSICEAMFEVFRRHLEQR